MALPSSEQLIIIIDSDPRIRKQLVAILERGRYRVMPFGELRDANEQLERKEHDAVILSLEWPTPASAAAIRSVKRQSGPSPLIALASPNRMEAAVRSLRHGVDDYLIRPPDALELKTRLKRLLERRELDSRLAFFQDELSKRAIAKRIETHSPAMKSVVERLLRVAPSRSTVMISGESGVGKELVARSIHFNSPRRERAFIALNCAAIPASLIESELFGHERGAFTGAHARTRGKFEIAHRGSLFLDEIGEMDSSTQAKLLRVLDSKEFMRVGGNQSIRVDVRLIAATNADLDAMVAEGTFRQDLYYRLKVVTLRVPPLRERRLDLPYLIDTFMEELARSNGVPQKRLTPDASRQLTEYEWPGNVRELKNLLESLLVTTDHDELGVDDLPSRVTGERSRDRPTRFEVGMTIAEMERELIRHTLKETGGNRTHSATLLGIGVRTLQRKMNAYDIQMPSTRRRRRANTTD
jgi:DNA-binding NtrC family response regulator